MSQPEGHYEVGLCRSAAYVRVLGLATMYNAECVRDFLEGELERGCREVVFDLAACTGMDSTFLGVLAGVATYDAADRMPKTTVINASADNEGLIDGVGLTELIDVCAGRVPPPDTHLEPLYERTREEDRLELIRDAHEKLVAIDGRNEEAFGAFLRAMEAQMGNRPKTQE